jgi:hypothetical protein
MSIIGTSISEPSVDSYLSEEEADELVLSRPNSSAWAGTEKIKALQEATRRIDSLPLRGRKYDRSVVAGVPAQYLQFPRIIDGVTVNYNELTGIAIVPLDVMWACIEEAIAILSDGPGGRWDLQKQGVQSFSLGGKLSETFATGAGSDGLQSAQAMQFMRRYL